MKDLVIGILNDAKEQIQLQMEVEDAAGWNINASKRTSDSLRIVEDRHRISLIIGGENLKTAPLKTLEIGREGGKVPYKFLDIIKQWIIDKGLAVKQITYVREETANWKPKYTVEERSLKRAAGAISTKIKEKGTRRHLEPRNDIYSNVVEATKLRLQKEITNYIANFVKTN